MSQFLTINLIHIISDNETHGRLSSPCWGAEPDRQALADRADLGNRKSALPPFLPGILGSAGNGCCRGSGQGTRVKGVPGFSRLFREEDEFALPVFMTPNHQVRSQTPLVLSQPTAWHSPTSSCRPLGQCRLRGCLHMVRFLLGTKLHCMVSVVSVAPPSATEQTQLRSQAGSGCRGGKML